MKCPKCNLDNPDDSKFCKECGTNITSVEEAPAFTKTLETPFSQLIKGTTLADRYEILDELGKGGMGEAYLAEDTNLKRQVAIKVLPQQFALDQERLARFGREARLLASLNHPNIATIHGLEKSNAQHFLVMELVEGETLRERISKGPLPVEETLVICKQIAEGLESAHEKGIIHRDLKPSNVKISPEGRVKILDFGIAKAFHGEAEDSDPSSAPAITDEMTRPGMILGTAAYMSPEQAKGKRVDKRTDIWAFGCILFECLAGKKAFNGDTISEIMASILKDEVDWKHLPEAMPAKIRDLLGRCLSKDPTNRVHDIADARIEIQDILAGPSAEDVVTPLNDTKWRTLFWVAAGLVIILSSVLLLGPLLIRKPLEKNRLQFTIELPEEETLYLGVGSSVALSPDGSLLIYSSRLDGETRLFNRPLNDFEAVPIAGTEGGRGPFFSPDGKWVAFYAEGKLKTVSLLGGNPQSICEVSSPFGGSWGENGTIYFGDSSKFGLMCVSSSGGIPEQLTTGLRIGGGEQSVQYHYCPQVLPGGKDVLFTIRRNPQDMSIAVLSLETNEYEIIIEKGMFARYLPSGHLLYAWSGDLLAVAFDLKSMKLRGSAIPVLEKVTMDGQGLSHFTLSDQGTLAYVQGGMLAYEEELASVDFDGKISSLPFPPGVYQGPRISPDGKKLVVTKKEKSRNLWIFGLERGDSRRLTDERSDEFFAIWTTDSKRIVFNSTLSGGQWSNINSKPIDGIGPAEVLLSGDLHQVPKSFSSDGKKLIVTEGLNPDTGMDIFIHSLEGDGKREIFLNSRFNEGNAIYSPDGRWIAYVSDESGQNEVYVRPYPDPGDIVPISTDGGTGPVWDPDGKALYYRVDNGDKVMRVSFIADPEFHVSKPELLFEGRFEGDDIWGRSYDISPDGKWFLMIKAVEQKINRTQIHVIVNWSEELTRLVPSDK
jgi:serine/threonine-protein kinase